MSASLIRSFGQTVTVMRDTNKEARVKGKRVDDVYAPVTMIASVQPQTPDEIRQAVGESSERNTHGIKLYSFDELKSVSVEDQFKADVVLYQGDEFEIVKVDKYVDNRMNLVHYRSFAEKVNKLRFKT